MWQSRSPSLTVALLTESVDWNFKNLDCKSVIIKVALLTESVDWNFINALHIWHNIWSLSSRRAWIEISGAKALAKGYMSRSPRGERGLKYLFYIIENFSIYVALLAESVDWNIVSKSIICIGFCRSPRGERGLKSFCIPYDIYNLFVALLAESVDWNPMRVKIYKKKIVALLAESVDWNFAKKHQEEQIQKSLSSRRAWIEISDGPYILTEEFYSRSPRGERGLKYNEVNNIQTTESRSPRGERGLKYCLFATLALTRATVALLAESVDWNRQILQKCKLLSVSLSSRRAWIEIVRSFKNANCCRCRSPRGERGLKLRFIYLVLKSPR